MAKAKKNSGGAWSDKKLLTWAIIWFILFMPVGIVMLVHYFSRKSRRYVPPTVGWEIWDRSVHESSGQADRIRRAITQDIRIKKYNNGLATIRGTGGDLYLTSFGGCSCEDFQRRGRPCKHMYKLAIDKAGFYPAMYVEGLQ